MDNLAFCGFFKALRTVFFQQAQSQPQFFMTNDKKQRKDISKL